MNATLLFRIPQADINLYEAATIAGILKANPVTRAGEYQFRYELEPDDLEWISDKIACDSAAFGWWQKNIREDFLIAFGQEMTDLLEEAMEIHVTPDSDEDETAEHRANYQREAFNW